MRSWTAGGFMLSDLIGATVELVPYLPSDTPRRGVIRALVVLPPAISSWAHEVCAVVQLDDGRMETTPTSHLQVVPRAL